MVFFFEVVDGWKRSALKTVVVTCKRQLSGEKCHSIYSRGSGSTWINPSSSLCVFHMAKWGKVFKRREKSGSFFNYFFSLPIIHPSNRGEAVLFFTAQSAKIRQYEVKALQVIGNATENSHSPLLALIILSWICLCLSLLCL